MSNVSETRAREICKLLLEIFNDKKIYVEASERKIAIWVGDEELKGSFETGEVAVNAPWRQKPTINRRAREDSWIEFNPTKIKDFLRELFS